MFKKNQEGKVGRPKKDIPFDPEAVKEYVEKHFAIEREIKVLREDKGQLKENYKDKVDMKIVDSIVQLVKKELKLKEFNCSDETKNEIAEIIKDKINMVVS